MYYLNKILKWKHWWSCMCLCTFCTKGGATLFFLKVPCCVYQRARWWFITLLQTSALLFFLLCPSLQPPLVVAPLDQTVVPVIWGPRVAWYCRTLEAPPPSLNRADPQCRGFIGWLISLPFGPKRPLPHSSVSNLQPPLLLVQQHWHTGNEACKEHSLNWYLQTFQIQSQSVFI